MNSLLLVFQASLLALTVFSLLLIIVIPITITLKNGWEENKNSILLGAVTWTGLVILVGTLNSLVI